MPIVSRSEFEAVLTQACIKIDKALYERGRVPSLEDVRRTLDLLHQSSRDPAKLKALRSKLDQASDVVSKELDGDAELREALWDCLDYLDYRV